MTLNPLNYCYGARPVAIHQAAAVPDSLPRRSPPTRLEEPRKSWGARRRRGNATGQPKKVPEKTKQHIKVCHWNAEGVSNKTVELSKFLHDNEINVCCIQETHLQEDKPFKIRGYKAIRNDRQGRKKGGVATLVRNNLYAEEVRRQTGEAEYLHVKITTGEGILDIVNFYCPNDKNLSLDTIDVPDSNFLIAGDFNCRSQSWGYDSMDARGKDVEEWQDENKLILVNDPIDQDTFYSRCWHTTSTPDLAFCTEDVHRKLTRKVSDQLGGSDHRPVLLTIDGNIPVDEPKHPRWNYKKANWGLFQHRTNELTKDILVEGRNINSVVKEYNAGIIKAAKESIPRGVRKNYTPYWNPTLQKAHDELSKAREQAESGAGQTDNIALQKAKALFTRTKLESKRKGWREKTGRLNMENDTQVWNLLKAMNDEKISEQRIFIEEEGEVLQGKRAATAFAKSYAKESNTTIPKEREREVRKEERLHRENGKDDEMQKNLTIDELKKAIKKLKKKKAPGPDNITNEMIQHLGNTALQKLLDIYNLSWNKGELPQIWKEAKMIPILKKGKNKARAVSYRPISLTSCVCKTMERMVNLRMQWFLESKNVLAPEQAGFRQYRSTEDQTTHLAQAIEDAFQAKKVMLATFIDFQKAFDKVWKDGLLVKLQRSGIHGNMYRWTKSYLHNRRARVLVNGECGKKVLLRQGVPQGGVLSPTLFILFINDVVADLPKGIHAALYADDLVLWCAEEYATTATYRMNLALEKLSTWTQKWCVTINKEKSAATLFTLSSKASTGKLMLDDKELKVVDEQTYLGVTFDKRLTWNQHVQRAESKARRKLNIMRKLAGTAWGANEKILKQVYQSTVRPHLEYGASAWMTTSQTHQNTLGRVQNQGLRIITGSMRSTPITKMEEITGLPPLKTRWNSKAMVQCTKIKALGDHLMHSRADQNNQSRLGRSNFLKETRKLHRLHQDKLPTKVEPVQTTSEQPPWDDVYGKIEICCTVPQLNSKDEANIISQKALTLEMIEEKYPQEAWTHVYTDGSATNAIYNGGAGVFARFADGTTRSDAIPTGKNCTNYRAEIEALVHAARILGEATDEQDQVVFLTDARSVLEATTAGKLPQLQKALNSLACLRIVLQWIPSHCGVYGNEEADKLAKQGSEMEQEENSVSYDEMRTVVKSFFKAPQPNDSYHQLTRQDQVIIFRLRTGHNKLNKHLHRLKIVGSPRCQCGEGDQTSEHVLQECRDHQSVRKETWSTACSLEDKLYGPVEMLQKTADFITKSGVRV